MKKIVTTVLGVSLLTSVLFANENHMNKEMKMMGSHDMKMMNKSEMTKMHKECLSLMKNKQMMHNSSNDSTLNILEEWYGEDDLIQGGG